MKSRQQHIDDIEMIFTAAAENKNFSAALKAKEMILKEQDKERKEQEEFRKLEEEQAEKRAQDDLTSKDIVPLKDLSTQERLELMGILRDGDIPGFEEIHKEIRQLEADLQKRDRLREELKNGEYCPENDDDTEEIYDDQEEDGPICTPEDDVSPKEGHDAGIREDPSSDSG